MTGENNCLYKNNAQSGNNKPEELAENHVVDHTTEEWNKPENIQEIASRLGDCKDVEALASLKQCNVPPWVFRSAAGLLVEPNFKQWVIDWLDYWELEEKSAASI